MFNIHCSTYINSGAVSFYRMKSITDILSYRLLGKSAFIESPMPMRDNIILSNAKSYRVQRLCTESTIKWLYTIAHYRNNNKKLKLIYDFDDMMDYENIPTYNKHKNCYFNTENYIKEAMNLVDIITTTNDTLLDFYSDRFNINKNKFVVIPNYIPKYIFDNCKTKSDIILNYKQNIKRPRIVFCCGSEHVNIFKDSSNPVDDFYYIRKWIRKNVDKYQFVFVGCPVPLYLKDLTSKFEVHTGCNILNYPQFRLGLNATIYVQPLLDNIFNKCKSTIKMTEAWVEKVPVLVSNISNYSSFDSSCVFKDEDDLDQKVTELLNSLDFYVYTSVNNYNKMFKNKLWLEDNLDKWLNVINRD